MSETKKTGEKLDLIMFSMSTFSEWAAQGRVNRNFHVLNQLRKDPRIGKILAVDFLPFAWKRAARIWLEDIAGGKRGKSVCRDLTTRCAMISDHRSAISDPGGKLFVYSTVDSIFSEKLALKKIRKIADKLGFRNVVLWSYLPMFVGCFDWDVSLKVFDAVDNWMEHPAFAEYRERLKKNYSAISKKADLIFTVSENLVDFFRSFGREQDVHWIPNGIDAEHFISSRFLHSGRQGQAQEATRQSRPSLRGMDPAAAGGITKRSQASFGLLRPAAGLAMTMKFKHPIVGYLGVIQSRLDMGLVKYLAEKNPDKSFILAGPVWPDAKRESADNLPNVYFPGPVSYAEAPEALRQFDVGIIPHVINEFTRSMNPLKLYEYLAAGLPVVTTPVAGIESFQDLIYVAGNREEFNEKINQALTEDNEDLRRKRQKATEGHSWEKRMGEMLRLIDGKMQPSAASELLTLD